MVQGADLGGENLEIAELGGQKNAQVGQPEGKLSEVKENEKVLAARLRQLIDSVAQKDAQIARGEDIIAYISQRYAAIKREERKQGFGGFGKPRAKITLPAFVAPEAYETIRNSVFFDADLYLDAYPDVKAAGIDPALHYLLYGGPEGRNPSPFFSAQEYLDRNPDIAAAGLNPLLHYELHGHGEKGPSGRGLGHNAAMRSFVNDAQIERSLSRRNRNDASPERDTILIVAHDATRTGAPILAWNLVVELSKRYNVVVLLKRDGAVRAAFEEVATAVVWLPDGFPMDSTAVDCLIGKLISAYCPKYAIANSVETRFFVPALERRGVPVVALVHEFSSYCWPPGTLGLLFEMASRIVFSAQIVAENAVKDYRSLEVRGFEILPQGPSKLPLGANPSANIAPARADIKALWPKDSEHSLLVIGMGTIQLRKGLDFFISAAAAVHRALPDREIRFAWVGKCYPGEQSYIEYLKEQVERSGLSETFAFIDEVDDLEAIYDQTDIFFLSSRLDPLPNVAIDAALKGIPVVCFDKASGMSEILAEAADTRELVLPHTDAGAAARLICDLADDPDRLARLSKAVRSVSKARFDMTRYVEAIDRLGRDAITMRDQIKRDQALISENNAFNADLYLGTQAGTPRADAGDVLAKYLKISRLLAPRHRPHIGLFLRRPLEGFHPLIYATDNRQFDESSGEDPLAHYVRTGRPPGRWVHQVLRPGIKRPARATALRVAVHGHFHYPELFPDFLRRLKCNATAVDLYLTTTAAAKAEELARHVPSSHRGRTKILVVPNRGRDIGAMLSGLGGEVLSGYDFVGHLHGKRSLHIEGKTGDRWRDFLWEHLIGNEFAMVDLVQAAFAQDEGLGLVFAEDSHLCGWDDNRACAEQLARRMRLAAPLPNHFDFPIGTMFWARPAALKPLFDLGLTWGDYPEEPLPIDGSILHALERLPPFAADKAGFRYATTYVRNWAR